MRISSRAARLARWLLARLVPRAEREFFLGDLEERRPSSWAREVKGALSLALGARGRFPSPPKGRRDPVLTSLFQDIRHALRLMRRNPGFAGAAVVTMALAIGGATAVFSVVNGVLLEPLPFRDAARLVSVHHRMSDVVADAVPLSPAMYFTFRDHARTLEDVGLWKEAPVTVTGLAGPERVQALLVTDRVFPILGVEPMLGRAYTEGDVSPGSTYPVILSHGYWMRRFAGEPDVVGRTLRVDGNQLEIIGVTPAGLQLPERPAQIFLPLVMARSQVAVGNWSFPGLARLRPGVSVEDASRDLDALTARAVEEYPGHSLENLRARAFTSFVRPLKDDVVGSTSAALWVVFGTVGLVLLIACLNVANLFLVRAEARRRDLALRGAIGASRGRLARQLLVESLLIGCVGGALGTLLAAGGIRLLLHLAPPTLPRLDNVGLDGQVLLFAVATSVATGLLFGSIPVLQIGRTSLVEALKAGSRGAGGGGRPMMRTSFAVSQVALALVLVVASGLMVRTSHALKAVPPGFQAPEEVLTFRLSVPESEVADVDEATVVHQVILEELVRVPGVAAAGGAASVAMDTWESWGGLRVEDAPVPDGDVVPQARFNWVVPGYFATIRNPLLAGRTLRWDDIYERHTVVVVTENLARKYWGDPARALGRRIRDSNGSPWREIVGVVGDVRTRGVAEEAPPVVYLPFVTADFWGVKSFSVRELRYVVRVAGMDPRSVLPAVVEAVRRANPNLAVAEVLTLDQIFARSIARTSFALVMLTVAGGVALVLGLVGVYAVVAYLVSRRTRELGVRLALGATRADVGLMVLRQGAVIAGAGVALGVASALALTRFMSTLLFGVSRVDPLTYGLLGSLLAGAVILASAIPARRAARVDPIETLRLE